MKIYHNYSRSLLFKCDAPTMRETVERAVAEGVNLSYAALDGANLSAANLVHAILVGANLKRADLSGVNLTYASLSGASLTYADLNEAVLNRTDLSYTTMAGADLRRATLPTIVRVKNLNRKILRAIDGGGELNMGAWHTCETTHCRAGWAIHLAGAAGKVLEDIYGPEVAATLIYAATYPNKKHPDFFVSADEAFADIKKCAGVK